MKSGAEARRLFSEADEKGNVDYMGTSILQDLIFELFLVHQIS